MKEDSISPLTSADNTLGLLFYFRQAHCNRPSCTGTVNAIMPGYQNKTSNGYDKQDSRVSSR